MTNPPNDQPLTFAKIAEGHWVNRETGVAIIRGGDGLLRVTEPTQYRNPRFVTSGGRDMKTTRRAAAHIAARFRDLIEAAHVEAMAEGRARAAVRSGAATLIGTAWIRPPALSNRVTDPATRTTADALRDTANHHQGSRAHAADDDHGRQLRRAGLVGRRGGLTRKGSIVAERLRADALDDAFGPL